MSEIERGREKREEGERYLPRCVRESLVTRAAARVVGTPRKCIASEHKNSRMEERRTLRPSALHKGRKGGGREGGEEKLSMPNKRLYLCLLVDTPLPSSPLSSVPPSLPPSLPTYLPTYLPARVRRGTRTLQLDFKPLPLGVYHLA